MSNTPVIAPFNLSYLNREPYITVKEYQSGVTAIDTSQLVPFSSPGANNQITALTEKIAQASAIIDTHCCGTNGTLCASQNTETGRLRSDRYGRFIVHPRFFPILEVDSFAVGDNLQDIQEIPLSSANTWIEEAEFIIAGYLGGLTTTIGPLEFSAVRGGRDWQCYAQWTYVNGWPNTTLTASVAAGASVMAVESSAGIYPGTALTLFDAPNDEAVQVAPSYVGGFGSSTTIPLASPLAHDHAAGISVSALPATIKQAAILVTSALIQTRGDSAMVLASLSAPTKKQGVDDGLVSNLGLAKMLLHPFRTVVGQS